MRSRPSLLPALTALFSLALSACAPSHTPLLQPPARSVRPAQTPALNLAGPRPDVILLTVSGRCGPPCRAPRDNHDTLGARGTTDALAAAFTSQGLSVQVAAYASQLPATTQSPAIHEPQRGFLALLADVQRIQATWPGPDRPRLVLFSHSQGGPWIHYLPRVTPQVTYDLMIDLDAACLFFQTDFSAAVSASASTLNTLLAGQPGVPSACQYQATPKGPRLSKDIVPDNVTLNLEVHSKYRFASPGPGGGLPLNYLADRTPNLRLDGTRRGLHLYVSRQDDHSAISQPSSQTMAWVTMNAGRIAATWK